LCEWQEKKIPKNGLQDWNSGLRICMKNKIMVVQVKTKKWCTTNHFRPEAST